MHTSVTIFWFAYPNCIFFLTGRKDGHVCKFDQKTRDWTFMQNNFHQFCPVLEIFAFLVQLAVRRTRTRPSRVFAIFSLCFHAEVQNTNTMQRATNVSVLMCFTESSRIIPGSDFWWTTVIKWTVVGRKNIAFRVITRHYDVSVTALRGPNTVPRLLHMLMGRNNSWHNRPRGITEREILSLKKKAF